MPKPETTRRWWPFNRKRKPFSDMTDAELGALTRRCIRQIGNGSEPSGIKQFGATCAALLLVHSAVDNNATTLDVHVGGVTIADKDAGEWTIVASKTGSASEDDAPVTLAGWLKPGKVDEAIACFDRLTTMEVRMRERVNG